jgi:hypothetical protein
MHKRHNSPMAKTAAVAAFFMVDFFMLKPTAYLKSGSSLISQVRLYVYKQQWRTNHHQKRFGL